VTYDLARLQGLFQIGEQNPITLRGIFPGKLKKPAVNLNFCASDHASIEDRWAAFAEQAESLNRHGYNIYTCINPIRPDLREGAVNDNDITHRRLLLIDLDRTGTHDAPATDDEIKLASLVADSIEGWLAERYDGEPTRTMSGSGIHLYYPLAETPNNRESRDHVRNVLKSLAQKFDTPDIHLDLAVSNASRITKVPGSVARKGSPTEDRPFRKAVFL